MALVHQHGWSISSDISHSRATWLLRRSCGSQGKLNAWVSQRTSVGDTPDKCSISSRQAGSTDSLAAVQQGLLVVTAKSTRDRSGISDSVAGARIEIRVRLLSAEA
jgi:hypothetical protein